MPGDIGSGYQVIEVTGMMAVYMLHSYPENRLCNIVYGDDIVLLIWCLDLLEIRQVHKGKMQKSNFQLRLYFGQVTLSL